MKYPHIKNLSQLFDLIILSISLTLSCLNVPKTPVYFNQHSNFPLLCHRIQVKTSDMLESPSVFLNKCHILTISSS